MRCLHVHIADTVFVPHTQAWSSWNGSLQAIMAFNSTELCPQLAEQMTSGAGSPGGWPLLLD